MAPGAEGGKAVVVDAGVGTAEVGAGVGTAADR
jgi:hypothetical protein